jgi:hypothetical protein
MYERMFSMLPVVIVFWKKLVKMCV